jgi:predicted MFS family arabinose efflux permease
MLFSLVAGALADRMDRRYLMMSAQIFMLVLSAVLALCTWTGHIKPWSLLLFTFTIGCGSAFSAPAWQASIREMVSPAELPAAVVLTSVAYNVARTLGPAIGGVIVATTGVAAAFALNSISYLSLILALAKWRRQARHDVPLEQSLVAAVVSGMRVAWASPSIRAVLIRGFLLGFGGSVVTALLPLVAKHSIEGNAGTYGVMLGAFGTGAVAGAMIGSRLRQLLSSENMVRAASIAMGAALVVIGVSAHFFLTIMAIGLAGAAWLLAFSTFNVTVQTSASRSMTARALSVYQTNTFGGQALGSWIWGLIATNAGLMTALLGAALVCAVCTLSGLLLPIEREAVE